MIPCNTIDVTATAWTELHQRLADLDAQVRDLRRELDAIYAARPVYNPNGMHVCTGNGRPPTVDEDRRVVQ